MKKLLLFASVFATIACSSQSSVNGNNSSLSDTYDVAGWPLSAKVRYQIKGSPMLSDNWGNGSVKFSNGRVLKNALLSFNLYSNQLYYKLDEIQFSFVDPINEFAFEYEESGKKRNAFFRNGYPGNSPAANRIFYEVLAEGPRFTLLKYTYKTLQDYYEYAAALTKIYKQVSEWYIYDKQVKSLKQVNNKQLLADLMPGQADEIAKLSGDKNYRFRSEKDLLDILSRLNR